MPTRTRNKPELKTTLEVMEREECNRVPNNVDIATQQMTEEVRKTREEIAVVRALLQATESNTPLVTALNQLRDDVDRSTRKMIQMMKEVTSKQEELHEDHRALAEEIERLREEMQKRRRERLQRKHEPEDDVRKYDTKAEHMHHQQQVHQHRDMSAHTDLAASNVPRNWRIARNESKMKALRCLDELSAVSS